MYILYTYTRGLYSTFPCRFLGRSLRFKKFHKNNMFCLVNIILWNVTMCYGTHCRVCTLIKFTFDEISFVRPLIFLVSELHYIILAWNMNCTVFIEIFNWTSIVRTFLGRKRVSSKFRSMNINDKDYPHSPISPQLDYRRVTSHNIRACGFS